MSTLSDFNELRKRMIKGARKDIASSYGNEEHILIQSINAFNETTRSLNLMHERLAEWYGIYYPEVRLGNMATLADLAMVLNERSSINREEIEGVLADPQQADSVYKKATASIGREMGPEEKAALLAFADLARSTNKMLAGLDTYIKAAAGRIMPNTVYLTNDKIAAELLAKAGSMERLAMMPASTIQLLGAEKALFKHIKFGSRPPKYGIIFKLPEVGNAQRDRRGMMARAYATKICIALKADHFSKNFIAEKLKKDLEASTKRINTKEIKPRAQRPAQPQHGGWGRRQDGFENRRQQWGGKGIQGGRSKGYKRFK